MITLFICYPQFLTPYSDLDLDLDLAVAVAVDHVDLYHNQIGIDEVNLGSGSELEVVSEEEETVVVVVVVVVAVVVVPPDLGVELEKTILKS